MRYFFTLPDNHREIGAEPETMPHDTDKTAPDKIRTFQCYSRAIMNMKLAELTKKRRQHIKSCRDNNDNSHEIIADLYSDPSHFIYELLQNADDAKASGVIFELTSENLKITHDGKRLFEFNDVESITAVNSSTKKDDVNNIGTFGAGFKSVFSITKTPEIHSGDYHFKIVDYIVPEEILTLDKSDSTVTILSFNNPEKISKNDAYKQIAEKLQALEPESLLFLRHIKEIQWSTESGKGHYLSEVKEKSAILISQVNDEVKLKEYILFKKCITIDGVPLNIAIAYLLNEDNSKIIPVTDSRLFVFFPTKEVTGLKFLIHAPYKTTPSRESIPLNDEQNEIITNELSILISESLHSIKTRKLLDVNFLSILPIEENSQHLLYKKVSNRVHDDLAKHPFLPTEIGQRFVSSEEALMARGKELSHLLDDTDCNALFERKYWIDTAITPDRTKPLWDYLNKVLKIPEIDMEKFCQQISENFIKEKSDPWMVEFYSSVADSKALYRKSPSPGLLRQKPIIRLEDGSHINPDNENGEVQVYLPSDRKSEFKTIKKALSEPAEAKEFLKNLGLEKPDGIAEIKEFIVPKYNDIQAVSKEDYFEDFDKVLDIWSQSDKYKKDEIIDLIKESKFIRSKNNLDNFLYQKSSDVYFSTENLNKWFQNNNEDESLYFIDPDLEQDANKKSSKRPFLERLGVRSKIKIYGTDDVNVEEHGYYKRSINGFNPDFFIYGLDFSLNNINIDRSIILWGILLKYPNKLRGCIESKTNQNRPYVRDDEQNSEVLKSLNKKYWLYDNEKQLIKKPLNEIMLTDLADEYEKSNESIDRLIQALGLKRDEIQEFEEKYGGKFVPNEEYKSFQEWRQKNEKQNSNDDNQEEAWNPEYNANEARITEVKPECKPRNLQNLAGQHQGETNAPGNGKPDSEETTENSITSNQFKESKDIGRYGEKIANRYLTKKYSQQYDVVWLNKNGNTGKGYDFVIKENGKEVFYYEVKSKVESKPQLFQISGTQWDFAQYLYTEEQGDMYKILVVSNVGKEEVKLQEHSNPVELWKKGEIYADPVKIKL